MSESRGHALCGAIGSWPQEAVRRLRAAQGFDGPPLLQEPQVSFDARGPVGRWGDASVRGWTWGPAVAPTAPPRGWEDAARSGSAGLVVREDGSALLHADAPGAVPVFVARSDDGVLFSSSLDALARTLPGPLHVDRAAWYEILAAGMVLSSRTPFEEIVRLEPGTAYRSRPGAAVERLTVERWPDVTIRSATDEAVDDVIARVRDVTERVPARELTVPLSGGWDSRFLAAVAAADGRPTTTVTAADEGGRLEEELDWAREVASRLDLEHRVLEPVKDWWGSVVEAAVDTHHLTSMHHWFEPLKRYLATTSGTVLDGLAAGVLLNNGLIADTAVASPGEASGVLRARLAPPVAPAELLTPGLAREVDDHVVARLGSARAEVGDHPAALSLMVLDLRTVRAINLPPLSMFAAEVPVATPFLDPDVLEACLSLPLEEKTQGRVYRRLLARLGSGLETIPSTNDTRAQRWDRPRPDLARQVAVRTRRALGHGALEGALGPRLRARVAAGRVLDVTDRRYRDVVRGLVLYTLWVDRYADVLADPTLVAGDAASGVPVGPAWTTVPAVDVEELADPRWLPSQVGGRTAWVRHDGGPDGDAVTVAEVRLPGPPVDAPAVGSLDAPAAGSGEAPVAGSGEAPVAGSGEAPARGGGYDRVMLAGPWRTVGSLERSLSVARTCAAADGQVALTVSLSSGASAEGRPSVLEVGELFVAQLDLVHAEVRQGQLRLLGHPTVVTPGTVGRKVPASLQAAIVAEFEKRDRRRRGDVDELERQLAAERDASTRERERRQRAERDLALEREKHARTRAREEELLAATSAAPAGSGDGPPAAAAGPSTRSSAPSEGPDGSEAHDGSEDPDTPTRPGASAPHDQERAPGRWAPAPADAAGSPPGDRDAFADPRRRTRRESSSDGWLQTPLRALRARLRGRRG